MQRELQGSEINEYKSFQYFMNEFLLINLKFLIFAAVMKFLEQKIGFLKTINICPRRKKKNQHIDLTVLSYDIHHLV